MKTLREDLDIRLNDLFTKILNKNMGRKIIEQTGEVISKKRNYLKAATHSILLQQRPLSDVSDKEIYWVIDGLNETLSKNGELNLVKDFKIKDIFTDKEIQKYSKSKFENVTETIYPISFKVLKISDDQWLSTISSKKLFELYKNQIINYNKNTQRPLKEVTKHGVKTYKINKNKQSVNAIKEDLKKGLFIPNCLTFNINMDNPSNEYYVDEENRELVLENGQFDLIDGFHRYSAITELLLENPDIEFNFGIWIMNFDENKSCRFIAQEDKRNKINKTYTKSLDALNGDNFSSRIVQVLNENNNSPFKGKLTRYNDSNINYDDVVITINDNFKCNTRMEANRLSENIIKSFEILEDDNIDITNLNSNEIIVSLVGISLLLSNEIEDKTFVSKVKTYINSNNTLNTNRKIINYYNN